MSEFDPFDAMRQLDGPVVAPESFREELYIDLRRRLDQVAVGAPPTPEPPDVSPRRGLVVAGVALGSVLLMAGLLSWLAPAAEPDVVVDPPPLSEQEPSTSAVNHNPDPGVASPATAALPGTTPILRLPYQFGGWTVLPATEFDGRSGAAVVWTGDRLMVWGGERLGIGSSTGGGGPLSNDGGIYNPGSDVWFGMPPAPLSPRSELSTAWTGSEMLVIGGRGFDGEGAAYNPATRQWRVLPSHNVPANAAAVWTGDELVLWGGARGTGAAYDPAADTWRDLPASPWSEWTGTEAVWTGADVIVWNSVIRAYWPAAEPAWAFDIAAYDPGTDSWRRFAPPPLEFELSGVAGVWTGEELILWGPNFEGRDRAGDLAEAPAVVGVALNPNTEEWRFIATPPFVDVDQLQIEGLGIHSAAWTGSRMVIWAGPSYLSVTGAELWSYDPRSDHWERGASSPIQADHPELVWTGDRLYAYGGRYRQSVGQTMWADLGSGGDSIPNPVGSLTTLPPDSEVPFEVLALDPSTGRALVADFSRGFAIGHEHDESLLPRGGTETVSPLGQGWMTSVDGEVWWFPNGIAREPVIIHDGPALAQEGVRPFAYPLPAGGDLYSESIWIVESELPAPAAGDFSLARQVGLRDGAILTEIILPDGVFPVATSDAGLLLNHYEWAGGAGGLVADTTVLEMILVAPDGSLRPLWPGWALGLSRDRIVWLDCDSSGENCRIVASELSGPEPQDLVLGSVAHFAVGAKVSPDGQWLVSARGQPGESNRQLLLADVTTGAIEELLTGRGTGSFTGPSVAWSANSEWILSFDGSPVAIRIADGLQVDLSESIPDDMVIVAIASR